MDRLRLIAWVQAVHSVKVARPIYPSQRSCEHKFSVALLTSLVQTTERGGMCLPFIAIYFLFLVSSVMPQKRSVLSLRGGAVYLPKFVVQSPADVILQKQTLFFVQFAILTIFTFGCILLTVTPVH